jgi:2-haloacid dehalogenase
VEQVKALLFDVFGTVVDWRSGVIRDVTALAAKHRADIDAASLADRWRAAYRPAMNQVRTGELPWTNLDGLHRRALDQLLLADRESADQESADQEGGTGLADLDEASRAWLTTCWHRLDPWPDAVAGLGRLKQRYIISAFSNGNVALLVDLARWGGLPWDFVASAELFRHYKPDPQTYLGAARLLSLSPAEVMLVAAHNDDLIAADDLGLATAFVPRPGELGPNHEANQEPARPYTCVAADFGDLADQLGA